MSCPCTWPGRPRLDQRLDPSGKLGTKYKEDISGEVSLASPQVHLGGRGGQGGEEKDEEEAERSHGGCPMRCWAVYQCFVTRVRTSPGTSYQPSWGNQTIHTGSNLAFGFQRLAGERSGEKDV